MTLTVCPAALALIERDEGLVLHAYRDIAGIWTEGFGHTGPDVHPGNVLTRAGAEAILARDVSHFAALIEAQIGDAPTTDNQFGAMVSLAFNIGDGAFGRSTVLRKHKARLYQSAADAFLLWDEVHGRVLAGLKRRRGEERALYLGGVPDLPTLVEGAGGARVCALQLSLAALGYAVAVDGDFGPQTAAAVRAFQEDHGLPADGKAGPKTLAALTALTTGAPSC